MCDRNSCLLKTFGCLEWESKFYRGIMRARCYPFNMLGHRFHNTNPRVHSQSLSQKYTRDILIIKKITVILPRICMKYVVFALAGCCAHCPPIPLEPLWRSLSTPSNVRALPPPPLQQLLLLPASPESGAPIPFRCHAAGLRPLPARRQPASQTRPSCCRCRGSRGSHLRRLGV